MWIHLIFSTKERYPFLSNKEVRVQLHIYMSSILRNHDCPTLQIGGPADHIHALFVLSKNSSIAQIVYEVKRGSSKWIKRQGAGFRKFHWQSGYGAFSVSQSHVE
jgi:REP element-mobilizing transposase RayT